MKKIGVLAIGYFLITIISELRFGVNLVKFPWLLCDLLVLVYLIKSIWK